MPVLSLIYTLIGGFFAEGLYKILIKAGTALAVGSATYFLAGDLTAYLNDMLVNEFNLLDAKLYQLMVILGVNEIINYTISYIALCSTLAVANKVMK